MKYKTTRYIFGAIKREVCGDSSAFSVFGIVVYVRVGRKKWLFGFIVRGK